MQAKRESTLGHASGGPYPGHWIGRFIWTDDDPHAYHYFAMARTEFELECGAKSAALHITCNDRYVLYVNGEYIGRGPARSDCRWKSFDSYSVSAVLRTGANVVAILGYHFGCPNAYTRDDRAGLFAQLDISLEDDTTTVVGSGEGWRVQQAAAWRQDVKPISGNVGVTEVFDSRAHPRGWTEVGFDDTAWEPATIIPPALGPWSYLEPRQTPLMTERAVYPVRIVEVGEVLEDMSLSSETEVPERLAVEPHVPLEMASIARAEEMLVPEGSAVVRSAPCRRGDPRDVGVRSPYVVLDFGRHVYGFPRISLIGPAGGIVEMTYGPDMVGGRLMAISGGLRFGDRYVMSEGEQVWRQFEPKQFRYLQVVFRNMEQAVSVRSVGLDSYEYPAQRRGNLECSDPILTAVWKAAIDTTYLQMEDTIVCDAVRERSSWGGDGAHGEYAVWAGFGDTAICDWHFRLLFRGQMADGMLAQRYPCTQGRLGGQGSGGAAIYDNPHCIPQHALVLAVMLTGEYYRTFDRQDLLEELYPALQRLLGWCDRHTDDTGLLYGLGNWNWMDWTRCDLRGAHFGTNAFYGQLLSNVAGIAAEKGRLTDATLWASQAERVRDSLRRLHWEAGRGIFVDSVLDGRQSEVATELTNALSILFNIASPSQQASVLAHMVGRESGLVPATPLFVYYVLEALGAAGNASQAYDVIRARYGPMMAYDDAPSIWEAWAPHTLVLDHESEATSRSMIPSRTHSGGVGVAWMLSKHLLGVRCDAAGSASCRIEPETASLEWASGTVPSVWGDIHVSWESGANVLSLDVELPDDLRADVVLSLEGPGAQVVHNGRAVTAGQPGSGEILTTLPPDRILLQVTGGRHRVDIVRQSQT